MHWTRKSMNIELFKMCRQTRGLCSHMGKGDQRNKQNSIHLVISFYLPFRTPPNIRGKKSISIFTSVKFCTSIINGCQIWPQFSVQYALQYYFWASIKMHNCHWISKNDSPVPNLVCFINKRILMSNTNLACLHVKLNYKLFPLKVLSSDCPETIGSHLWN